MRKDLPSLEQLRQLLHCEPETGKLYWKTRTPDMFSDGKRSAEHNCNLWNSNFAGKEALTADNGRGYKRGIIWGNWYLAHRVIWAMVYGEMVNEIDHINGVRSDNRIINLRDGSNGENSKNQKRPSDNTSGVSGVSWNKRSNKWVAYASSSNTRIHLGSFFDFNEAVAARKAAEVKYGYHPNHGRD